MNYKHSMNVVSPVLIILFWGLIIAGGIYWYRANQLSEASSQRVTEQSVATAKAQYMTDAAPVRATCAATSTTLTGIELYRCNIIYIYENDNSFPGLDVAPPSSDDIFAPDLPSICRLPISQLTPFEISQCLTQPPPL